MKTLEKYKEVLFILKHENELQCLPDLKEMVEFLKKLLQVEDDMDVFASENAY
jgi:hypothetical protein